MITALALASILHAQTPAPTAAKRLTYDEAVRAALVIDAQVERSRIGDERARLAVIVANLERVHASVDASIEELYAGASSSFFAAGPKDPAAASAGVWGSAVLGLANVQASVQAPIFSGFRVESDIARAEDLERAASFDLKAAQRAVAVAVADAYFSARRLELLEKAQSESEARLEESERVVVARLNAGLAAGLDKNRASSRRAQLDVERSQLVSQDREARVKLASALGIDEPVELVDDPPAFDGANVGDVDKLVSRALDARPELKAAEWRAASVDEEKRAAESAYWPQLGAGVLAEVGNNPAIAGAGNRAVAGAAIPFAGSIADVQAGVTLSMNLFDTYTTTHNVEDAGHRRRLADADTRALRRQVENDVRIAHAHVLNLREQVDALEKARAIEADNVSILQHAYERGEVLLTELLDEQLRLADFERQIVDLRAQLAVAKIELDSATGSLEVSP